MWAKLRAFFKDSEVIFWSRLQLVIGFAAGLLTYVDPSLVSPIMDAKYLPYFLFANGVATEYLRRRRDHL
ncbi:MAG TPA: hypothetical protein VHC00_10030 [Rhizobiaceae bacterium]|nr:hypothetical protein [Rhizobiaceae bacterium]